MWLLLDYRDHDYGILGINGIRHNSRQDNQQITEKTIPLIAAP